MLDLAAHIIETKMSTFDVSQYEDRYESALIDLIKAKQAGREPQPAAAPHPANVINLMDALRRSIATEKAAVAKSKPPEAQRPEVREPAPQRRAAAAATARDKVQKSPRSKKAK